MARTTLTEKIIYQPAITAAATTFDGSQEGGLKIFVFDSPTAQTLELLFNSYSENDEIYIENRGPEFLEILPTDSVRLRGDFDIDGKFLAEKDSIVYIKCRGLVSGKDEFTIEGIRGGSGAAVSITQYNSTGLLVGGTQDITVIGNGFTENMLLTLTGNATLNSWTFVSRQEIVINATATGVATDQITVNYDNGDITIDTNAFDIVNEIFLMDAHPFEAGYASFRLNSATVFSERWRRSLDDQKVDIALDANGKISLASLTSLGGDVGTWLSGGDAFRVVRYNQGSLGTGTGYDLQQVTNSLQPKVASAGVLVNAGGINWAEFDATDDIETTLNSYDWLNGDYSIFSSVRFNSISNSNILNANASTLFWFRLAASTSEISFFAADPAGGFNDVRTNNDIIINSSYQLAVIKDPVNISMYKSGAVENTTAAPATDPIISEMLSGGTNETGTHPLDGYKGYDVYYQSDQTANLASIETFLFNGQA